MTDPLWLKKETQKTLERLLPRLAARFEYQPPSPEAQWATFERRLRQHFPAFFQNYFTLYNQRYDFFYHLDEVLALALQMWLERPRELKALDEEREDNSLWFQSHKMLGGVCYVDLFAGNLKGIREKIPYFRELGLTYLHLMPLFLSPDGHDDGGYAVSSYREVNPSLGDITDLVELASALRGVGISLVLDFVFNHTSDEHTWARAALAGDEEYQAYYRMYPDRTLPDAFEAHMREIFPEEHPGAFTYRPEIDKWVWTTFHAYQWDLNYENPQVFKSMAEEMLNLANMGVEVLRLDAVAFIWKRLGTESENLPEAHALIRSFNAICQIAAPAVLLKSEAIVHPDEVVKYIAPEECQLSYNPLLMALMWESLATRQVRLLAQSLRERFQINPHCAWVNYVRSHDDIGWTFSDGTASFLGINGYDHRQFLNDFYTGKFPGSFARGLPFQENMKTGDRRISGTTASLAGLEKALQEQTEPEVELAIRRILLMHGITLTIGGIPLIYLGDELGQLNDYGFRDDPAKADDNRWVHRTAFPWERLERCHDPRTIEGRVFDGLLRLIALRKENPVFSGGQMHIIDSANEHVLGFVRQNGVEHALVFANFSEESQLVPANQLRLYGLSYRLTNMISGEKLPPGDLRLEPYAFICLR